MDARSVHRKSKILRWRQGGILKENSVIVSPGWAEIARMPLLGRVMVVGACDTGKSTFARWLFEKMSQHASGPIAFLDGDPGQSTLGPPATITLTVVRGATRFPGRGRRWRRFVGSTSPRHHSLQLLSGVARLVETSGRAGSRAIVYDTTGLVDPDQGGVALKLAKIALLNPEVLVAFQRQNELEPLLAPLRKRKHLRVVELDVSPAVCPRGMSARQHHRARRYAQYFAGADVMDLDPARHAVFLEASLRPNQLLAFEDALGFVQALGIAISASQSDSHAQVLTPLRDPSRCNAIRLADLTVDPVTFRDAVL
jgi:polynucleotide 5'-hydroxyl-kinase GRC3/NOL9